MFGPAFYHNLIRKYVIIFGNLFNDINIERQDSAGNRVQTLKVPLAYGPRSKFLRPLTADERITRPVAIQLPRIGFEMTSIARAVRRQPNKTIKNVHREDTDKDRLRFQYIGVPYDLGFELGVYTMNAEDGVQILEQIFPFFMPDWTVGAIMVPEMSIHEDVVIELLSSSFADAYQGELEQRRVLIWNLKFNVQARFYGPVRKSGLIKRVQIDFHAVRGSGPVTNQEILETPRHERYVLVPGLTAEGEPTTDPALSIPYTIIEEDDNWGYAETLTHYEDGMHYDPVTGTDVSVR